MFTTPQSAAMPLREYRNRALQGTYDKGRLAAKAGAPRLQPYTDKRTFHGRRVTFSRAFITAWLKGYDDEIRNPSLRDGELL